MHLLYLNASIIADFFSAIYIAFNTQKQLAGELATVQIAQRLL